MKFKKLLLLGALVMLSIPSFPSTQFDLSQHILKLSQLTFYPVAGGGFAVYDDGDEHLKVFDWNFKLKHRIPLKKGEGPGEINGNISGLCITPKGAILLNLSFDDHIRQYNPDGKFLGDLPFKMQTGGVYYQNNHIIMMNNNFDKSEDRRVLIAKIINPVQLTPEKDIVISDAPAKPLPKELSNYTFFTGTKMNFSPGENGNIFVLFKSRDTLYEFDDNGLLVNHTELPYPTEIEKTTRIADKSGKEIRTFVQYLHSYYHMQTAGKAVYLCYYKCLQRKPGTPDKFRLSVLRIIPGKPVTERIFYDKLFYIMGGDKDMVYFFDANDYSVTGMNHHDWK